MLARRSRSLLLDEQARRFAVGLVDLVELLFDLDELQGRARPRDA
jgi:hypothetical protein